MKKYRVKSREEIERVCVTILPTLKMFEACGRVGFADQRCGTWWL